MRYFKKFLLITITNIYLSKIPKDNYSKHEIIQNMKNLFEKYSFI